MDTNSQSLGPMQHQGSGATELSGPGAIEPGGNLSITFGKFVLPPSTTIEKHKQIGDALRSYTELTKLVDAVGDKFPLLIVGGAIRDLLVDPTAKPKDIDIQIVGELKDIVAVLAEYYPANERVTNAIGIVVGKSTEDMEAIDVRPALGKYFKFEYIENNLNCFLFDLKTDHLIDMTGTGISDCHKKIFRIPAECMRIWNGFPEPSRVHNGKLIRVLKMLAKGFAFAEQKQLDEFSTLFREFLEPHCELVIPSETPQFSTLQMVLGQTIRGDKLNFKDGSIIIGTRPLYDKCIQALEDIDCEMAREVVEHMRGKVVTKMDVTR